MMEAHELLQHFDARVWAKEFVDHVKAKPEIATDEGAMSAWFANALMRGHDEGLERAGYRPAMSLPGT